MPSLTVASYIYRCFQFHFFFPGSKYSALVADQKMKMKKLLGKLHMFFAYDVFSVESTMQCQAHHLHTRVCMQHAVINMCTCNHGFTCN